MGLIPAGRTREAMVVAVRRASGIRHCESPDASVHGAARTAVSTVPGSQEPHSIPQRGAHVSRETCRGRGGDTWPSQRERHQRTCVPHAGHNVPAPRTQRHETHSIAVQAARRSPPRAPAPPVAYHPTLRRCRANWCGELTPGTSESGRTTSLRASSHAPSHVGEWLRAYPAAHRVLLQRMGSARTVGRHHAQARVPACAGPQLSARATTRPLPWLVRRMVATAPHQFTLISCSPPQKTAPGERGCVSRHPRAISLEG